MKQRLGIANAILHGPELLILDEPTNGLDPIGIAEVRDFIKTLSIERGKTILISSHILSEIALLADDIGIIDHGVLLEENSMNELQKKKNEAKKNQKVVSIKELKLRPMIDTHDYEVKVKQAKKFLSQGDKVKFTMRYKGREMSANDMGKEILNKLLEDLEGLCKVDAAPKMEGKQMFMIVSPA